MFVDCFPIPRSVIRGLFQLLLAALITALAGCGGGSGGGGGGGGGGGQPPPDFSLSPSSPSLSLQQLGGGVLYSVAITPVNGFNGSVTITFGNLPAGVTTVPAGPYTASPNQALSVDFAASNVAAVGNSTITVQAVSGKLTHSTTLSLTVSGAVSFQLSMSPSSLTIGPNGYATAQLTLTPGANFGSNTAFLSIPTSVVNNGVRIDTNTTALTAAQPQATVTFQASFQEQPATAVPVPITGTVASVIVTAPFSLNITDPLPHCGSASRSTSRRTDMDPTGVVYDPLRRLVFAAVDQTNSVQVLSAADGHTVGIIPIAAARQLDLTPDGSRLLVGSQTGYMSWVDPNTLQVIDQVPIASASNLFNGTTAITPLKPITLASGKVLVVTFPIGGGGYTPIEWDPVANTFTNPLPPALSAGDLVFSRSTDHSKVVAFSNSASLIAVFDSATDSFGPVENVGVGAAALNPNGSRIAVIGSSPVIPGGTQITLFDGQFHTLATHQINNQTVPNDLMFSRDGSLLYLFGGGFIAALNASDLSLAGVIPSPATGGVDDPPDVDETGMIFVPGAGQRSLGFVDASSPCALGVNQPYNMSLSPPQGVVSSPSQTTLNAVGGLTASSQIYFGAPPASPQPTPGTNLIYSPPTSIQVTSPPALQPGTVNVTVTNSDGWVAIVPDGFTYGSTVLAETPTSGPATGGTSVTIYGYGLGFGQSQVQVTVGGRAAIVTSVFAGPGISPFPFPMDQVKITVPPGNPGPADIVVTTPVGSATVVSGFHYLQSVQSFPVSSTLGQVVYDHSRQRLYASDYGTNQIDVFDLVGQRFLAPILVGNSPLGVALTPDLTTLVTANGASSSISIVDLAGVAPTKTVSVANLTGLPQQCGPPIPYAVVTTSKNQAVIALTCPNVTEGELIVLDLATQAIGCGASTGCTALMSTINPALSQYLFLAATADGTKILVSNGAMGLWDVGADTFSSQPLAFPGFFFGAVTAAAADGNVFAQNFELVDASLYLSSLMQGLDYLIVGSNDPYSVFGEKLHPSGALLYIPRNDGVDIYDAHQGLLARRIVLPLQVAFTFDAMALDDSGSKVFLINSTGLSVVTIADLPLTLGSVTPAQGLATGGASVRLRGSGFQSGSQVMFGNAGAVTSFVDSDTLQVTTPAMPTGPTRVTIVNPDGTQYSLDDAFTAN